jgi:hypothetical protein
MTRRPMNGARRNTGDTAEHAKYGVGPATDYGADTGEPIFAPFAGRAGGWWSGTGGNTVQVAGAGVTFVGQHLSSRFAVIGSYVNEGDLIGYVGSTGSATTGPHLHWWIELNGTRISGEEYMQRVGLGYTPYKSTTPNTSTTGGGTIIEEDDMTPDQAQKLDAVYAALFGPKNLKNGPEQMNWINSPAGDPQKAYYGVLPIAIYTQDLVTNLGKQVAALSAKASEPVDVTKLANAIAKQVPGMDPKAIAAAVEVALADDFAKVNANVDQIPVGFTPIIKE